ncbi:MULTISPECIES: hydrogenase maturation nickel metallochaperone HypA [unclassified Streptomyces]|uniref:hydrogenase maturation nickel metallochaperone HypA n=1 Tax=unclassified Streptomyces TaxID=2593676 RepID=UPI0022B72A79|nr:MULTISPECIES: hydrogenase maturation nickel metallochaperone HypA [unclassified Streptomyces]MCZ7416874.1 hydrogenase maturation nickel metallochaperone HypA [Streptomyces sp. WMMC897]MCZ7433309.1 hydrogenase maturation nickel metallochaperone HypA [Streptomyces sp. WMMC1477]
MHELSIATAVVESADEAARRHGATAVESVRLRVGELAGVVPDALRFSFELAAEGTALAGARLLIEDVPARARCARCPDAFAVGSPPRLECPDCGGPAAELLTGRELEIAAVTLPEPAAAATGGTPPPPRGGLP